MGYRSFRRYALTLIISGCVAHQAGAFDPDVLARLQAAVTAVQQSQNIKGVSAAVMMNGEVATFCAGESHAGVPMHKDMVLGIGSNTKTVTATAMLMLRDDGMVGLDDPIGWYLPTIKHVDSAITIRQLLTHTSGLADYADQPSYPDSIRANPSRIWTTSELVTLIPPPDAQPGAAFNYCNTNYLLAGMIVERVAGMPLHHVVRNRMTQPLAIDTLRMFPDTAIAGELAHRWMGGMDFFSMPMESEWSGAWAAGAIIARAKDYAIWYDALFSGRLITLESLTEMTTVSPSSGYGLGITRQRVGNVPVIGHGGQIRGYSSIAMRVPQLKASIVVLTNSIPSNPVAVADTMIRVLLSEATSVADNAMMPQFPAQVWTLAGALYGIATTEDEVRSYPAGVYVLRERSATRCVVVLGNGTVGYRSTTSR